MDVLLFNVVMIYSVVVYVSCLTVGTDFSLQILLRRLNLFIHLLFGDFVI